MLCGRLATLCTLGRRGVKRCSWRSFRCGVDWLWNFISSWFKIVSILDILSTRLHGI